MFSSFFEDIPIQYFPPLWDLPFCNEKWPCSRVFEIRRTEGAEFRQFRQKPHIWRSYCPPNIFCCFVYNGFAKHVPWLLISCLTDCLCNLGFKYSGRICPGFINSKSGKAKKKYMCVYCHMSKKSRVGRSGLFFFFYYYYYRQNRK